MKMSQIFSFFQKHSLNVLLIVLSFTYLPCYYCERNLIFIWLGYYKKKKQKNKQTNYNKSVSYYELQTTILPLVSKVGFRGIGVFSMGLLSNHIKEGC